MTEARLRDPRMKETSMTIDCLAQATTSSSPNSAPITFGIEPQQPSPLANRSSEEAVAALAGERAALRDERIRDLNLHTLDENNYTHMTHFLLIPLLRLLSYCLLIVNLLNCLTICYSSLYSSWSSSLPLRFYISTLLSNLLISCFYLALST